MKLSEAVIGREVRNTKNGLIGKIFSTHSGPILNKISVDWNNPVQRVLGPELTDPKILVYTKGK